ncbi:MAG: DNA polymerase III subunit gamma/tau [Fimbriimonadaceae bacterium]
MSYQALFRKYRSQSFDELVGQEHIVQTLRNAIAKGKIAQAYLFTGPRGTGKTSTARLLAKALNCTGGPSADIPADCPICADITRGNCMDVVEMDAASESGVAQVREHIVEASEYQPTMCKYRVFIIDEVHDLSRQAFDALLKTIEEPPAHVIFILATTEFHKVPPTIRSRCQKFEFHRGSISNLVKRLNFVIEQEGIAAEPAAVTAIARLSDGGYRDALTLLEQAAVTMEGTLTLAHVYDQLGLISDEVTDELLQAISRGDLAAIMLTLDGIYQRGRDPQAILESMMYRLSDLTRALLSAGGGSGDSAVEAGLTATAARMGQDVLLRLRAEIASRHKAVKDVTIPRVWLEAEFLKIALDLRAPVAVPVKSEAKAVHKSTERPVAVAAQVEAVVDQVREPEPKVVAVEEKPVDVPSVSESSDLGDGGVSLVAVGGEEPNDKGDAGVDAIWQKVVKEMAGISKAAAIHLKASQAVSESGGRVTVAFKTMVNAEWVDGKAPLVKAIRESWAKHSGAEVDFDFTAKAKKVRTAAPMEGVSVESSLEGDRLAEAAKRIFGTADGDAENTV